MQEAIVMAACRPRREDRTLDLEGKTVLERFGDGPFFKNILFVAAREEEWVGRCVFEHPAFARLLATVRKYEDAESAQALESPSLCQLVRAVSNNVRDSVGQGCIRVRAKRDSLLISALNELGVQGAEEIGARLLQILEREKPESPEEAVRPPPAPLLQDKQDLMLQDKQEPMLQDKQEPMLQDKQESMLQDKPQRQDKPQLTNAQARKKRCMDSTKVTHIYLSDLRDIRALWEEYTSRLCKLEYEKGSTWRNDKQSNALWNRKIRVYREIARVAHEKGSVEAAIKLTQARLDEHKKGHSNGWSLIDVLDAEQKMKQQELDKLLKGMHTNVKSV